MNSIRDNFIQRGLIIVFLVVAFVLRLFHIDYGLPGLYLEDEAFFVQPALHVADGSLSPDWFGAPAQPQIYVMAGLFRGVNWVINHQQDTHQPASINYQTHVTPFQIAGRLIGVVAGTAVVWMGWLIGRFWSRRAGWWAAALLATNWFLVFHSHIIRPDIIQALCLLVALYSLLQLRRPPLQWRWIVLLGIAFGLAVDTKFPSLFFLPTIVLVCGLQLWQRRTMVRHWIVAGAMSVVTSFLAGPFLYLHFHQMLSDLHKENRNWHAGHDGYNWLQNLWWYVSHVLQFEAGSVVYTFVIITTGVLLVRWFRRQSSERERALLIVSFAAWSYLLCIASLQLHWERWTIPTLTLLLIIAGVGIDLLSEKISSRWIVGVLLIVALLAPTVRLARVLHGFAHPYTEVLAQDWMTTHLSATDRIVAEPLRMKLPADWSVQTLPNLAYHDLAWYRKHDITHVVVSDTVFGRIFADLPTTSPEYIPHTQIAQPIYRQLLNQSQLVFEQQPHDTWSADELLNSNDLSVLRTWRIDLLIGPAVRVYQFNTK
jgi:hypothetical protein